MSSNPTLRGTSRLAGGDFEREVDRDIRTIALDDQGGAGADGEARRPIGEQGGRQARRHKASAVNFPSMTRRYLATTFSIAVAGALAIAACSTDHGFAGYCDAILSSSTKPIQKTDAHLGHLAIAICLR